MERGGLGRLVRPVGGGHLAGRGVDAGPVRRHDGGDGGARLVRTRPDELEGLLSEVRPLLPDRLLDRTTRLLDHILKE
ncbi:MAG: hypothetical protein QXG03_10165 [Halalkalicoccus sp.]